MADVITRLKLESGEYDAKIKRAVTALQQMEAGCRKVGGSLAVLEKDQKDYVQSLGRMETVSTSVRGKIGELTNAYTELAAQYRRLTDEEKKGDFGKALSSSLSQLKQRITDSKNELNEISKELSGAGSKGIDLSGVMQTLGSKLGVNSEVMSVLTTRTMAQTTAIGAMATAVVAATKAWADYNAELAKQDQITTVTTGLKGINANQMTDAARAMADTYGVDFRSVINSANALMAQFGKTGDEAISLLRQGMQGMIMGDGPKLLSMIQTFAPAFRDAGISASQLIAVIQNSEGGLFSEQNMNAILMGIKNIRQMTDATAESLTKLGIDGNEMSRKMSDGSMTVFDALQKVAVAIEGAKSGSKEAGEVMQHVFGRQGAMQGLKLGRAIAELNTNLEETKKQTGEVGVAYDELYQANKRLNSAIRDCFEYDGWDQMATGIKANLVGALASVLEITVKIKDSWVGTVGKTIFDHMTDGALRLLGPLGNVLATLKQIAGLKGNATGGGGGATYSDIDKITKWIGNGSNQQQRQTRYDAAIADLRKKLNNIGKERTVKNADGSTSYKIDSKEVQEQKRTALENRIAALEQQRGNLVGAKDTTNKNKPTSLIASDSIAEQERLIADLTQKWRNAGGAVRDDYAKQLKEAREKLKDMQKSAMDTKSGNGGKTTKEDIKFADDSIMAQEKLISDLTQKWKTASGELRDGYLKQLDEAKDKLKEMTAVNVVPGSLQDYQNKLKDANAEVLTIREELLRMQKAGEDPVDIQVKKDELEIAIERVNSLQSDIDTLNGKTAEINIHLGIDGMPIGDTQMGEEMVNGLSTSLVNAADNLDLSGFTTALQQAMTNGLGDMGEADFSEYLDYMKEQLGDQISEQEWPTIEMAIKTGNIEELENYIKKLQKAGTDTKEAWKGAAGSIAQLGSALQSIEDPGVKAAGTVIAAIANVALGFANASKGPFTSPWEWIAFAASGLATMISTIGTIHSLTGFANGGIYDGPSGFVPGNRFSGDNVMANGGTVGLNSGELILNRAQQGVIAQELEGGGFDSLQLEAVIGAEEIMLVTNNRGSRTQRGEYVQSNNRRG